MLPHGDDPMSRFSRGVASPGFPMPRAGHTPHALAAPSVTQAAYPPLKPTNPAQEAAAAFVADPYAYKTGGFIHSLVNHAAPDVPDPMRWMRHSQLGPVQNDLPTETVARPHEISGYTRQAGDSIFGLKPWTHGSVPLVEKPPTMGASAPSSAAMGPQQPTGFTLNFSATKTSSGDPAGVSGVSVATEEVFGAAAAPAPVFGRVRPTLQSGYGRTPLTAEDLGPKVGNLHPTQLALRQLESPCEYTDPHAHKLRR